MMVRQILSGVLIGILVIVSFGCSKGKDDKQNEGTSDEAGKEEKAAAETEVTKIGKDGAEMVLIPAGDFEMGIDPAEIPGLLQWLSKLHPDLNFSSRWFEDETPRHTVYLDAFYIDKYEVTNAQYRKFVEATGHKEPEGFGLLQVTGKRYALRLGFKPWSDENYNGDNQPVVCVSWEDAKAYAEWAGKRLPTEAEWEKAARGGIVGKRYPWGDDWPPPAKAGNFADEAFKKAFPEASGYIAGYDDGYAYSAPVNSPNPNAYGLHYMAGNVWEWCADWYDRGYYSNSPRSNPTGPDSGQERVMRGGSWYHDSAYIPRAANRDFSEPSYAYGKVGFRCVAQE